LETGAVGAGQVEFVWKHPESVRERAVLRLRDHLFHDRVSPVVGLGVHQRQAGSGKAPW
jgi:hypothetical protein